MSFSGVPHIVLWPRLLIARRRREILVMWSFVTFIALVVALMCSAAVISAQSLGDIAKREQARRKAVTHPGRVYTNESLRRAEPASSGRAAPAADAAQDPAPTAAPAENDDKSDADDQKKGEAYWKDRLTKARAALDRAKTFAEALQSRINALTIDFAARSDPAQRAVIEQDRQKAVTELDRVNREIKDDTKAIADIQEEARRAGVPAAWYR
jgi:hypothetical protein